MKSILAFLLTLSLSLSVFGQASKQVLSVGTIADLHARRPQSNEVVSVRHGSASNLWVEPRLFVHDPTSTLTADGVHVLTNAASSGRYVSKDRESPVQNVLWFGAVPVTSFDSYAAFNAALNYTNSVGLPKVIVPAGDYAISLPLVVAHNYPLTIEAGNGGFDTGWISTNFASEARLVYTGPATNTFFSVEPTLGFRCGLNIKGLTFDANGLADVALNVSWNTRGRVEQVRPRNSTGVGIRVAHSYYVIFENVSVSSNERAFTTKPAVGMQLTNENNNCVFIGTVISGTTNWALTISDSSVQNQFIGAGFESNDGGGVLLQSGASENAFYGLRLEANGNTNRFIQIDNGAYKNVFVNLRHENFHGKAYIDGSYTTIDSSQVGAIEFGPNAGNNTVRNTFLANGTLPTGYTYFQNLENVIDLSATLRTNTAQNLRIFYGPQLSLWEGTDADATAVWNRSGIYFGDGISGPSVGWTRLSAQSLATSNAIVMFGSGLNAGLLSAYSRTNDAQPRISLNVDGTFSWGFGLTNPVDFSFTHVAANELRTDGGIVSLRTNINYNGFAVGMTNDANLRAALMAGGRLELGDGVAARSVKLEYTSAGTATLQTNLIVPGTITLGGVARSSWPSGSGTNASTVYIKGTQVDAPNFTQTTEFDWTVIGGTNVAGAIRDGSIATNRFDATAYGLLMSGGGSGDVVGPASSVDGDMVAFDGATGKLIKTSGIALTNVLTKTGATNTYQLADSDLTDLADGSLTGSKVGSGIDDDNISFDDGDSLWTATTIGSALEELNDSINAGAPNGTGAKLHWSQLLGVPAGFADGTDDGAGGGSGDVVGPASSTDSVVALYDGTTGKLLKDGTLTEAAISANLTEAEASALYQKTNTVLTTLGTTDGGALTNLNASNLASGTVPTNRLAASITGKQDALVNSAGLAGALSDETGSGAAVFGTSPTLASPTITGTLALDAATVGTLTVTNPFPARAVTNATASRFAVFGADNRLTNDVAETGSGAPVRATSPVLVTPTLGAASATSLTLGATNVVTELALKAPLASPALTGTPTVNGTNLMAAIASAGGGGGGLTMIDGSPITNVNFRSSYYSKATVSSATNVDWIPQPVSSASTASFTPAFNSSRSHEFTLTNTATLNAPSGVTTDMVGDTFRLVFIQDATGSRTLTAATNYLFGTDITGLTLTTNAGARDYAVVYVRRTNVFDVIGFVRGYAQ